MAVDLRVKGLPVEVGLFRTELDETGKFQVVDASKIHKCEGDSKLVHQFLQVVRLQEGS